jgi:UDP-N-acetylglucosamine 2-epimerase (non-hydrolysing)
MHILHVVGARPNFVKVAPVMRALSARDGITQTLVHTGQHYDAGMSDIFFEQLGIPKPHVNLAVGSGSHAQQTGAIMTRIEPVLLEANPDTVAVYGDVNSTVAAALVCAKLGIRVAHIEAGLRSFDRTMPEEINRVVTDRLADILLTPSEDANANLTREGIDAAKVKCVGNVMIDSLVRMLPYAMQRLPQHLPEEFALVTLHRPSNVDNPAVLHSLISALCSISDRVDVLFPVHPRTRARLEGNGFAFRRDRIHLLEPLPYLEFLGLQQRAKVVITDSGGIQEETTYLGIPCLTVRENTERPITVTLGTNTLVGTDTDAMRCELEKILCGKAKRGKRPPLWDGHTGERIARELCE